MTNPEATPAPMTCDEAREALWPVRQPKLVVGQNERARTHVDACRDCRDFLAQSQTIADAYDHLACAKASPELRERVFDAIAVERAGQRAERAAVSPSIRQRVGLQSLRRPWRVVAVATVVLASAAALTRSATADAPEPGAVFVDDYLRRAVGQERITTSDPGTVGRWLARELGLTMTPLEWAGLVLEGAEICLLNGRLGAMIQYRMDGVQVSHYLVPWHGAKKRAPTIGLGNRESRAQMPLLVTWSTASMEQALVGDVGSEKLLELARSAF